MNRCKHCIFFNRNNGKIDWYKYGKCGNNKLIYGENDANGYITKDLCDKDYLVFTDMLVFMDGEHYYAGIEVGENFGCIHFKEANNEHSK